MSKNNNNTPRLRFPEFTGEWVEKKLGESVGSFKTGKLDANAMVEGGEYRFYTCAKDFSFIDSYAFEGDCIMIAGNGVHLGYVHHYNGKFNAYQRTYVLSDFNCDSNYLECCIRRFLPDRIRQEKKEGNMPYIVLSTLTDMLLYFPPSPEEQKKIADCLTEMDNLISAQSQKVEALKEKKKGMMQQLFPQKGETTPRLRFPGFTGEWEEKKLGDCLEERNEQFPESEEYPLMAFVAEKGVSPKGEKYDRSALVKDATNKKYKRTELGDFIYSSNNLESGSIGFNAYGSACISPVYSIFASKNNVHPIFIGTLLTQKSFIAEMVKFRQGVVYGQWKIPEKEFLKMTIYLPSPAEQQKIADCLSELDTLIAAETAQLESLKDYKKGLMQQLFPQPAK